MRFTIEAQKNILDRFRLQTDNSWREIQKEGLRDTDLLLSDPLDTIEYCVGEQTITLDGKTYRANPQGTVSMGELINSFHITPRLHRLTKPRIPDKTTLVRVIQNGDDSHHNVLVIDLYGEFGLKTWEDDTVKTFYLRPQGEPILQEITIPDYDLRKDPTIAVRGETFGAGNDYVGREASFDQDHIDLEFHCLLGAWHHHLKTGELNIYVESPEYTGGLNESELLHQVRLETEKLR
ncbi:hypothetical protein CMO92_00200 [Candidatus Woesearchaeota archaeon]|nr:hypothetical protein [Candidatus Woesearchaeota archaeon]